MKKEPLVSVIIPTYNRAHLIVETLDSVLAQTYQNWECIIVDDGSSDNTDKVVGEYVKKDSRFKYYHRPDEHLPGGNGARNYGFKMSQGDYIQWFDSDDLMVAEKLELKVKAMQENDVDFVVSKSKYFNLDDAKQYRYQYSSQDINLLNYTKNGVAWITDDMFIKRNLATKISYNEALRSGQEGNYSYKLLLETNSILKLDRYLSLRRYHKESIGAKRRAVEKRYLETTFNSNWITLNELIRDYDLPTWFEKYVLLRGVKLYLKHGHLKISKKFHILLWDIVGYKAIYFYMAYITRSLFGKYIFFYNKMK